VRVYLDSCILIYLLEGQAERRDRIRAALSGYSEGTFCASDLVRLECRVGPLRTNDTRTLAEYDGLFLQMTILPMPKHVFDLATELRAQHGMKTPDALHLATAMANGCAEFWTGDLRLSSVGSIQVRALP
jgi:predicted nucleic acid-binding protein